MNVCAHAYRGTQVPAFPSFPPPLPNQARADPGFVRLRSQDEEEARGEDQSPLPPHWGLVENVLGDLGDLDDGEEGTDPDDDRDEEEAVAENLFVIIISILRKE